MYMFKSISISRFNKMKFCMFLLNKLNFAFDKNKLNAIIIAFN